MAVSTHWLESEHRELDHALAEVEFLAERRAFHGAAKRFHEFHERLLQHVQREEADAQLAARLKPQHAQLEVALEAVASSLAQGDYSDFCYGVTALGKLLAAHQRAEGHAAP